MTFLLIIELGVLILIGIYFLIGVYFYNMALNSKKSKPKGLEDTIEETLGEKELRIQNEKWLKENSKDVYITTTKYGKLKLHAYELENFQKSEVWVIVIHGYLIEGKNMAYYAKEFYNKGYNVLLVDLRGHGQSEGNYVGMGWHDRLDIIDWISYLLEKNNSCKIILHGVSMGGATVMMATGEELPDNVKVAIEDCGYSSIWDEFKMQLKLLYNLPTFPVLNAASTVCNIKAGYKIEKGSSVEQVKKSKTPTLFIHGDQDKFVPFEMLDKVYEAANCKKEKLVIEEAAHAEAVSVNPELYWKTIDNFIEENL